MKPVDVENIRRSVLGAVLTARDAGYAEARQVWNGLIERHPAVIIRPAGPRDVAAALTVAQRAELEVSVRGGGHNFGGAAVGEGGLTIDLSSLRAVAVDPKGRTARCGGGTTWAELDAATQLHALATPGGTVSHTGVGGLTLGGGFGWLTGRHGLSCDNLVSAEVVTASGDILRAAQDEHSDLLWALRGGGGNFGVVTEFEFRLHPVGPLVQMGLFFWEAERGAPALRLAREIVGALPDWMGSLIAGLSAPPAPFVPEQHHLTPGYALVIAGFGPKSEHAELAGHIRTQLPPLWDVVTDLPYVGLQKMLDDRAPWGILGYERSLYLDDLGDEVIRAVTEFFPRRHSPQSFMPVFPMQGACTAPSDEETAFGGPRSRCALFNVTALATEADLLARDREWARAFCSALTPYAAGLGGYVNFMNDYEDDRVRAAFGPQKYERLSRIKAEYDPHNVFHRNPNIKPSLTTV
jgi:FAD/FMN-containing dehydrogenase